jgi:8-oxo-dGTP pyrophosphatase MutT (NUDIX family)
MNLRNTVRILLLNEQQQLLLMRVVDPTTTNLDKTPRDAFWCTVGGKIEPNENINEALSRELFEETGLLLQDVEIGPTVWFGRHKMILSGKEVELDEKFVVVKTNSAKVSMQNFTENEKSVVTHLEWLTIDQILGHKELIYPAILKTHLTDIINGKYPPTPIFVDLNLQP